MNNNRVKNDCIDALVRLSKIVDVEYEPNAIDDAYFLNTKKKSNLGKKTVVVKFSTKSDKDKHMSSKPKSKETERTNSVYVNDFHSRETLIYSIMQIH